MTTSTDKKVTRVTSKVYPARTAAASGAGYGKGRRLLVTIAPGDLLVLRMQGLRHREYITIEEVYRVARSRRMFAEASTKRAAKARRRKA